MRSLFIQLSLLVGTITTLNLSAGNFPSFMAVQIGLLVGCTVCFGLILGDLTINSALEGKIGTLTSVRFIDETKESDWLEESILAEDNLESASKPQEALAA